MKITNVNTHARTNVTTRNFSIIKKSFRSLPRHWCVGRIFPWKIFARETGDEDYTCVSRTFEFKTEGVRLRDERAYRRERNASTVYEYKNLNDAFARSHSCFRYFSKRGLMWRAYTIFSVLGIFEFAISIAIFWIINCACVFVGFVRKMFSKVALRKICNTSIDIVADIFFFLVYRNG